MTLLVDPALIGSVRIVLAGAIDDMELVFIVAYVGPYSAMSAKLASGSFSIPTYLMCIVRSRCRHKFFMDEP